MGPKENGVVYLQFDTSLVCSHNVSLVCGDQLLQHCYCPRCLFLKPEEMNRNLISKTGTGLYLKIGHRIVPKSFDTQKPLETKANATL